MIAPQRRSIPQLTRDEFDSLPLALLLPFDLRERQRCGNAFVMVENMREETDHLGRFAQCLVTAINSLDYFRQVIRVLGFHLPVCIDCTFVLSAFGQDITFEKSRPHTPAVRFQGPFQIGQNLL